MKGQGLRREAPGVFYAEAGPVQVEAAHLDLLAAEAAACPLRRARICAHRSPADSLHEMVILLLKASYVRPHRHQDKRESYHVIEGRGSLLLFDEGGRATQCLPLGDPSTGRTFFARLDQPVFHALVPETDRFVFHETTEGPLDPRRTEAAAWAPGEGDSAAGLAFLAAARAPFLEVP